MTASFPLIYFGAADTRPAVRVLTRRPMILPPLGCSLRHVEAKTEITLSAGVLDQMDPADVVVIGPVPDEVVFEI